MFDRKNWEEDMIISHKGNSFQESHMKKNDSPDIIARKSPNRIFLSFLKHYQVISYHSGDLLLQVVKGKNLQYLREKMKQRTYISLQA